MIIQILVSQRQTVDPLRQQLLHRMLHKNRVAPIQKALGQPRQQVQPPVGLPQQQPTAVSGQRSSIETGYYLAGKMVSKLEGRLVTLCHSGSRGPFWPKHVVTNMFMPQDSAFRHLFCEKCGLVRSSSNFGLVPPPRCVAAAFSRLFFSRGWRVDRDCP